MKERKEERMSEWMRPEEAPVTQRIRRGLSEKKRRPEEEEIKFDKHLSKHL